VSLTTGELEFQNGPNLEFFPRKHYPERRPTELRFISGFATEYQDTALPKEQVT
jgi:hypothetical protein